MKTAAEILACFRVLPFNAAVLVIALSLSGSTQQTSPAIHKDEGAGKHRKTIEYKSASYGFSLTLPKSWKGYRVSWSEWEGSVLRDDGSVAREFRGPKLRIRHPEWNEEHPREDLPIMIFTIAQWNEDPVVSAAPIGPAELGRNRRYVFALPPRWDYDFAEGWEEAQKILTPDSLHTFVASK
jgi:hypothetical protein